MNPYPKLREGMPWFAPKWAKAITLPPFGIWIDHEIEGDRRRRILDHELIHWEQYLTSGGPIRFYWRYLTGWVKAGFSYEDHEMEIEARERSGVR